MGTSVNFNICKIEPLSLVWELQLTLTFVKSNHFPWCLGGLIYRELTVHGIKLA